VDAAPVSNAPGTVGRVTGGERNRWLRPLAAGLIALALLLLALLLLDRAGAYLSSDDVVGAFAVAFLVGAMLA